jgi:hypothetical protein
MAAAEIVLSREEVRQLARSATRAGQVKFLRQNGIRHYVDAHGWPVVLRAAVEGGDAKPKKAGWQPGLVA